MITTSQRNTAAMKLLIVACIVANAAVLGIAGGVMHGLDHCSDNQRCSNGNTADKDFVIFDFVLGYDLFVF